MPEPILILILAAVGFVEQALFRSWNRFYFTFGLPIFTRRVLVSGLHTGQLDFPHLNVAPAGRQPRWVFFKQIAERTYAFRDPVNKFFLLDWISQYPSNPIKAMHCVLILDESQQQVIVKGYPCWFTGLLALIFFYNALNTPVAAILLISTLVLYILESRHSARVAQKVAERLAANK